MSIETIFALGDDALGNQFRISINPILAVLPDPIEFRTTQVSIPEQSINTYPVKYKTQTFNKPSGSITTPTQFTFTFRNDKYWALYRMFSAWLGAIANNATGAMAEDVLPGGIAPLRTTIVVQSIDSAGNPTSGLWTFSQSMITNLQGVDFSQDTDSPILTQVTMNYLKMVFV